jgi:hypothetical protein
LRYLWKLCFLLSSNSVNELRSRNVALQTNHHLTHDV